MRQSAKMRIGLAIILAVALIAGYYGCGGSSSSSSSGSSATYEALGITDTGFGINGVVTTTIGAGADDGAYDLAIQPDGKILVTGWSRNLTGTLDAFLARYTVAGILDSGFGGGDGIITQTLPAYNNLEYYGLGLQANGKIIVAGRASAGAASSFLLARYNANGTLDTSFGGGNGLMLDLLGTVKGYFYDMLIQPDGYIVAGGFSGDSCFTVARFK